MHGIRRFIRVARSPLAGVLYALLVGAAGAAEVTVSREQQLVSQMCSRGLGEAAIRYIRDRRSIERDGQAVAWWVTQEMECHAQLALSNRSEADGHWTACKRISEEYLQTAGKSGDGQDDPRWPWIQWQLGRCLLLESQSRLAWTLASPANSTERERALALVRSLVQLTDELQAEIRRRQPLAARQTGNEANQGSSSETAASHAPAEQLRNLSADTQLLRCEAMIVRSQLYSDGTNDRSASLAEVAVLARDVLNRTSDDWPMRPALMFAEATARLESGDESAMVALQKLSADEGIASRVRMLAGVALARAHGRRGQLSLGSAALNNLQKLITEAPELAAIWKFARIELAYWDLKLLPEDQRQDALRKLAEETRELGAQHGDYWRTRAEGLMVAGLSSQEIRDARLAKELLIAEVRQLTAAGKTELACEKLLLARDTEASAGNGDSALELSNMAAVLFRHINRWEEAANAIEKTSTTFSRSEKAAEYHVSVIRDRAEMIRSGGDATSAAHAYQTSLEDHLKLWPQSPSAAQVSQWYHDLLVSRGDRKKLIESLLAILSEVSQPTAADSLLVLLSEQCVLSSEASKLNTLFTDLETRSDFKSQELRTACRAAVCTAWALLDGGSLADWSIPEALEDRMRFLQDWSKSQGDDLPSLNSFATTAIVLDSSRLKFKSPQDAKVDFNRLSAELRIAVAPAIVALLDASLESDQREFWKTVGLHAEWASSVLSSQSTGTIKMLQARPVSQAALARIAISLGDSGQEEALQRLAQQHSKNGLVQLMLSNHLLQQRDSEAAKRHANQLAALSQPGRPLHWSARWCMIRALKQEGRNEEAEKAAQLVLATQPGMNRLWTERFEQIAIERQ